MRLVGASKVGSLLKAIQLRLLDVRRCGRRHGAVVLVLNLRYSRDFERLWYCACIVWQLRK